jgi:protein SCO1
MRNKLHLSIVAFLLLTGSACGAQRYAAKGLVVKVDAPHKTALISCEKIPDFMDAMLMSFDVRNPKELSSLRPGTMIEFTLVVDQDASYIENIHVHQYLGVEQDPLTAQRLKLLTSLADKQETAVSIKVGDPIPDFALTDQTRKKVAPSQFTGKVLVITFTYTHCALPNFCFRIANNFRRLQSRFPDAMGNNLVLMTITFDPAHDTPEVMAKYGKTWNADPNNWKLLTGSPTEIAAICNKFGISYWSDEGLMNHTLHTFVVGRDGKLVANLEGNEYTADQLGDLVQSLLSRMPSKPVHLAGLRQP